MTTANANKTVVGVYNNIQDAKSAVSALENSGFSRDDVSIIVNKNITAATEATDAGATAVSTEKTSAVASDVGIGAALGGVGGLLWSFAALAIPGVGPVLALGPLAAALGGAGLGAVAGGIIGALTESGIPEAEAQSYAEVVRRGQVLVSVRSDDARADRARDILDQYGAVDVEGHTTHWRERGWSGYDPGAEPLSADELRREREYYGSPGIASPDRNLTRNEMAGTDTALRGQANWPHKEAYPIGESQADVEMDEMDANTSGPYGDSATGTRPADPATVRAESGFDRAKDSAVQSARRLRSRVYDTRVR